MSDDIQKPPNAAGPFATMEIRVAFESRAQIESGPVSVGWLLATDFAGVLYEPPTRVRSRFAKPAHPKSVSRCPAVLNHESRLFEIKCPFDLNLEYCLSSFDAPAVRLVQDGRNTLRDAMLDQLFVVSPQKEWRDPEKPVVQLRLPYIFLADEPVYMAQVPPFYHRPTAPLPGLMIGGRFPIDVWPRTLSWGFEWHEPDRPLVMKRGEPLFYLQFETVPQDRAVQIVEAERTEELQTYLNFISGVVNYVGQTFSLFEAAEARRPARLIEPVRR